MRTLEGYKRLTMFADAIVAIAITLLVLPLVDIPLEGEFTARSILDEHWPEIGAFAISFAVIFRLWGAHHAIGEHYGGYDRPHVYVTMIWLLSIVFLPFPSELIGRTEGDRVAYGLYIGTLFVNVCCLAVLAYRLRAHPALRNADTSEEYLAEQAATAWINPVLVVVAFVLAVYVPPAKLYGLLLLLLDPLISRVQLRLRRPSTSTEGD